MWSLMGGSTVFKFKPADLFTETLDCAPSGSCIGQELIDRQQRHGSLSECKIRKKQIEAVNRLFYYEGIFHMHENLISNKVL